MLAIHSAAFYGFIVRPALETLEYTINESSSNEGKFNRRSPGELVEMSVMYHS